MRYLIATDYAKDYGRFLGKEVALMDLPRSRVEGVDWVWVKSGRDEFKAAIKDLKAVA